MATRRSPARRTDSPPGIDHLTVVPENHENPRNPERRGDTDAGDV